MNAFDALYKAFMRTEKLQSPGMVKARPCCEQIKINTMPVSGKKFCSSCGKYQNV